MFLFTCTYKGDKAGKYNVFSNLFFLLVPLRPVDFNITQEFISNSILTFEWKSPTGKGPEIIVDNYTISIRNTAMSSYVVVETAYTPWNVTDLSYNVEYEATLTASNCNGESRVDLIFKYGV